MRRCAWVLIALLGGCALAGHDSNEPPAYLALGDSVAFGYDPRVAGEAGVHGYPEAVSQKIGVDVTNASCPGEASGGFISSTGTDNHCRENRQAYPLHVSYSGTQLAYALDFLAHHRGTTLVTIDLGANDAFVLQKTCAGATTCVLTGLITMLGDYEHNMRFIFGELRKVYDGPIVAVQMYNPSPKDSLSQYGVDKLNAALATTVAEFGGVVADAKAAFATAGGDDPCKAGLLIPLADGTCDIHPTAKGHELIATAVESAM